ncbi:acyltransferase family protein [Occallatibacter riparius]|uniref:Acyltransferase n=1 Tax=Occallatibacter riparius TaxID=1002689 RepID=A0A9J7BJG4_9BACT|nr:acyltransferase [Occallatibacter riparius]UWZ82675.1 acyltransferase [Occallatibacter riparius]
MPEATQERTIEAAADAAIKLSRPRDLYIDRLRSIMTAFVILHHTAITYGAIGGWFWYELKPSRAISSQVLIQFCTINQAYFMGFFFLLAGYFTPASLERKGYGAFLRDRFTRLGLPLLGFILILGPLTAAIAHAADTGRFWEVFPYLAQHFILIPGPLWFAEALLIFCLAYCGWRAMFGAPLAGAERTPRPVPSAGIWLLSALLTGIGAFAIRQFIHVGVNIASLQLGYFATYIVLFAAGIAAWRYDWIRQLNWNNAKTAIYAGAIALPLMPAGVAVAQITHSKGDFAGGISWHAALYALWEPFVAWGFIAAWLLFMRRFGNQPSAFWSWLNRRAYAVYIIHPPILVGITILLHLWTAPALVKFAVTGTVSCAICWLIADPLVRMPGLRRIL